MKQFIKNRLNRLLYTNAMEKLDKTQNEIVYALKCNSVFQGSKWLNNKQFAPGAWAIGWPGLYILYRALEAIKPANILEMGLGETTKMTGQFAAAGENIRHFVFEHDKEWISFFDGNIAKSNILTCELEKINFRNKTVVCYKDFKEKILTGGGYKFDLIVIDGPFGSDNFSRIDVLDIIPDRLSKRFAIIMDDTNRIGEQQTVDLIEEKLKSNNIPCCVGEYEGIKKTTIIVSHNLKFLCSLQ